MRDDPASPLFAPLRREPVPARVAARLRGQIEAGELRSGERLPGQRELARTFAVGIGSVREALALLCEEGWVETRAGSGTYVR